MIVKAAPATRRTRLARLLGRDQNPLRRRTDRIAACLLPATVLAFLLLSDAVLPLDHLPRLLQDLAHVLPAAALTDALRAALTAGNPFPTGNLIVLAIWAIVMLVVAARTFKWE